ncbi:MAG: epoxyqueuosine reductase QueH [Candidatus Omnitrophota bacterium]|nr:epoxyqueuosine reductase QueH [Candidatus Omnitrophota bacterium]
MKKVLLHICCGVCALGACERLKNEDYHVTGYFYNPNIALFGEYLARKQAVEKAALVSGISLIVSDYLPGLWRDVCGKYPEEPEGGARCLICYQERLKRTFDAAEGMEYDYFTTTLTISPHKSTAAIFKIGRRISPSKFLAIDFKSDDGFKKTMILAKQYNLYHQKYCGCEFSQTAPGSRLKAPGEEPKR